MKTERYTSCQDSPDAKKVLGYSTAWAESLVAVAYAHGRKSQVVNIGIDVMRLALPRGVPARKFLEAFTHKVRRQASTYKPTNR